MKLTYFDKYFIWTDGQPIDGLSNRIGQAKDGLAMIQIVGDVETPREAALTVFFPPQKEIEQLSGSRVIIFADNLFDGDRKAVEQIANMVMAFLRSGGTLKRVRVAGKNLVMQFMKECSGLIVTCKFTG